MASAGGASVGGWQIYEEVNPTVNRSLSKQGYLYKPLGDLDGDDLSDSKFNSTGWKCLNTLFPGITNIKRYSSSTTTTGTSSSSITGTAPTVTNNLVACAVMDVKAPGNSKKIDFKSEFVARDETYGFVMGTKVNGNNQANNQIQVTEQHELLLFKKNNNNGEVDKGYFGEKKADNVSVSSTVGDVTLPDGNPFRDYLNASKKLQQIFWANVKEDSSGNYSDLLGKIKVKIGESHDVGVWGDNNFSRLSSSVNSSFVNSNSSWNKLSNSSISLSDGYKPFKDKKLKGMNHYWMEKKCNELSSKRNYKIGDSDKWERDICYVK